MNLLSLKNTWKNGVEVECFQCKSKFLRYTPYQKNSERRFCNKKCQARWYSEYMKEHQYPKCVKCGCIYVKKHECKTPEERIKKEMNIRFLEKVKKAKLKKCWLWTGAVDGGGYGKLMTGTRGGLRGLIAAHRYSWMYHRGEIPKGLHVLHHCDVRRCVNPNHLYLGTQKDNVRDAIVRGRFKSFLSKKQLRKVRMKYLAQ